MNQQLTLGTLTDFTQFMLACGQRRSDLTTALTNQANPDDLYTPLACTAISTPPQEGKTTWVSHYIAWQLVRNPRLNVIYASYSQFRANSVSRLIRQIVERFTPLPRGAKNVSQWRTQAGGGLLAAGRGTGVTGFSCDLLIIDDPVKDMKEALSEAVRKSTVEWFSSVLITRMASMSHIFVVCTRWHKDDLVAHVVKELDARYINVPAQATDEPSKDPLGRKPGEWLKSVQNRSTGSWETIKRTVGTYVWQALYQGDPQVTGGSYIDTSKIDVVPWEQVVVKDQRGFLQTLQNATVIQSWDLAFTGKGDYVAGQVWADIAGTWFLLDRFHKRVTFTQTVSEVQQMAARWPQTTKIYVENAANGAALVDTLKKRAALIKPVSPLGSKETRALAIQPLVDAGRVKVVDLVWEPALFDEWKDFPFAKHDDQVDAMTQALLSNRKDYFRIGS